MNIQDILDDLDAGEHIPNNVVRALCNELLAYQGEHSSQLYVYRILEDLKKG